ncbi:MAG: hypothetical protein AAE987_01365 [Thermoplasmataceae archaeon]
MNLTRKLWASTILLYPCMQKGVSTKKKAEVLEELFYIRYSKFTTSRITDITTREILNCSAFPVKVLNLEM